MSSSSDAYRVLQPTQATRPLPTYDSLSSIASRVAAYHFCDKAIDSTLQVPAFVRSVAAQLSKCPFLQSYEVSVHISLLHYL